MSIISKLPSTTFALPSGDIVETKNILKTIIIDDETKTNAELIKTKNGSSVSKLEHVSYRFYEDKTSLYWLTTHLNDIDSFLKIPTPKANFEANLPNRYPGKVYYIKDGKNISGILPGDLFVLYAGAANTTNWKVAGTVKEYDPVFRRIIIEKEIENTNEAGSLDDYPLLYIVRYDSNGSQSFIINGEYQVGRTEAEYQKALSIYDTNLAGIEISPYRILDGSDLTENYDFTNTPASTTIIYQYNNSISGLDADLSSFYFHTLEKEEHKINNRYNEIKYMSQETAFSATTFVNTLLAEEPIRGQKIIIEE